MPTIENSAKVTSLFGHWPSFHDAETHHVVLARDAQDGPTLDLTLRAGHTLVSLRFTRVLDIELSGFNEQNVIFELNITDASAAESNGRPLRVELSSSYGLGGTFACARAIVTDVVPLSAVV